MGPMKNSAYLNDYCLPPFDCIGLGVLLMKAGGGGRVGSRWVESERGGGVL